MTKMIILPLIFSLLELNLKFPLFFKKLTLYLNCILLISQVGIHFPNWSSWFSLLGKEEIVLSDLSSFLATHTNLNFLGLVLTEACQDEMFTDENHPDFSTQIG